MRLTRTSGRGRCSRTSWCCARSVLVDVDQAAIEKLIGEQYRGKERMYESNLSARQAGRSFAKDHVKGPIGLRVKRAYKGGDRNRVLRSSPTGLAADFGGATVC